MRKYLPSEGQCVLMQVSSQPLLLRVEGISGKTTGRYRQHNDRPGGQGLKFWASIVLVVTSLIPMHLPGELGVWSLRGRQAD